MPFQNMKRNPALWRLRSRTLDLGTRTLLMAIVNITPDSFSDAGQHFSTDKAIAHGLKLLDEGADLLDLGAESTRPGVFTGAEIGALSTDEEQARLLPVVEGILRQRPDAILSVDTYKAATAEAAIGAGAEIINDVSGFTWDAALASICAVGRCGIVLTHTRGVPSQWHSQPPIADADVLRVVLEGLQTSLQIARTAGVQEDAIVVDPGYGFGKRSSQNYVLLAGQAELLQLGRPLLAGVSRKSFLMGSLAQLRIDDTPSGELRETASEAAMVAAILHGASIVRVHSVRRPLQAATIADALLRAQRDC